MRVLRKGWYIMYKVHYNVNGLINVPTKTQVKNELEELEGVHQVNIDLGRSTIEVEYNAPANKEDIKKCIEHVGCRIL
jgi:hypothetical protein